MTTLLRTSTFFSLLALLSIQSAFAHNDHAANQQGILAQLSHLMSSPEHLAPALIVGIASAIIGTVLLRRKTNIR